MKMIRPINRRLIGIIGMSAMLFFSLCEAMKREKRTINRQQLVWVKSSDDGAIPIERWKINEMDFLLVMFMHQRGTNSLENPVNTIRVPSQEKPMNMPFQEKDINITAEELLLLSKALDAVSAGDFDSFYNSLNQEYQRSLRDPLYKQDRLRMLINAADKVGAIGLYALCASYFFSPELQKPLLNNMIQPIADYINNIVPKKLLGMKDVYTVVYSADGKK